MTSARADVREGGRWSLAQRAKNDVLYLAVRATLGVACRAPAPLLRRFGRALGAIAHVLLAEERRIARGNVEVAFPELGPDAREALVRASYRTLGELLGETVASLLPSRPAALLPFARGARETLELALGEGRGVVFASAHLGPWERVASTLVASGFPLVVVAREAYDPRLTRLYDRLRGGRGVRTIYRSRPGAATGLLRTLRRGGLLGIPMDLDSRVPSVMVPLFGRPARTAVGPARLALRTGAAVVVGTAAREDGRLVIAARRVETGDLAADGDGALLLSARINEVLSERIRAMPDAWPWMHPRFGREAS